MDEALTRSLDLMRRAQQGDGEALERLISRYYDRVRWVVRSRLNRGLRQRIDSGDILQQVFAKVVRIYDRFQVEDEASLIGWMARIAERQVQDETDRHTADKRNLGREVSLGAGDDEGPELDPAAEEETPSGVFARVEEQERLSDAIAELPETYRELILCRDYIGMSWDQVAEQTGRPSAAAARMMYGQAIVELGKRVKGEP